MLHHAQRQGRKNRSGTSVEHMRRINFSRGLRFSFALVMVGLLAPRCAVAKDANKPAAQSVAGITQADFHGWAAFVMRTASAQVVVVPEIGRVMKFDLIDSKGEVIAGPVWNNPSLSKDLAPDVEGWRNLGGDKAWPAPQSEWPKIIGRGWPPPAGFDATAFSANIKGHALELVSPVDAIYGVRVRRTISLDSNKPVLRIRTAYEKVQGSTMRMAVWTITQLDSPERAFILLPEHSVFENGYVNLFPDPPTDVKVEGRLLSLTRRLDKSAEVGTDGDAILWVGKSVSLLLETNAPPVKNKADWADQGSRTEIYTSPGDHSTYVELEFHNPLRQLNAGNTYSMEGVYTLLPRTEADPTAEAKKIFKLR